MVINVIFATADTLIAALTICGFIFGAWHFGRWWILLFAILPMLLYYSAGIVVIGEQEEEEDAEKES